MPKTDNDLKPAAKGAPLSLALDAFAYFYADKPEVVKPIKRVQQLETQGRNITDHQVKAENDTKLNKALKKLNV